MNVPCSVTVVLLVTCRWFAVSSVTIRAQSALCDHLLSTLRVILLGSGVGVGAGSARSTAQTRPWLRVSVHPTSPAGELRTLPSPEPSALSGLFPLQLPATRPPQSENCLKGFPSLVGVGVANDLSWAVTWRLMLFSM